MDKIYTVANLIEDLKKYDVNTQMDYYYIPHITSKSMTHLKEKYNFDLVFDIDGVSCTVVMTAGELIEKLSTLPQHYEMYVDDFGFTFTHVKLVKYTDKDCNRLTLDSQ